MVDFMTNVSVGNDIIVISKTEIVLAQAPSFILYLLNKLSF